MANLTEKRSFELRITDTQGDGYIMDISEDEAKELHTALRTQLANQSAALPLSGELFTDLFSALQDERYSDAERITCRLANIPFDDAEHFVNVMAFSLSSKPSTLPLPTLYSRFGNDPKKFDKLMALKDAINSYLAFWRLR